MQYEITGGIDHGIHYTRFIEKVEEEEQSMQPKEGAQKSHGETETQKLDTE